MAEERKSAKQAWPAMLLAIALAETAHAPLMDGAIASDKNPQASIKATSADKKAQPPLAVAPVSDPGSTQEIEKTQLPQKDLFSPLPPPPPFVAAVTPSINGAPAEPISLLNTGHSTGSGVDLGDPAVGGDPAPTSDLPPTSNGSPVATNPVVDPVLGDPGNGPTAGSPIAGTPNPGTSVPEPGGLSVIVASGMLLGRRKLRR